MHKQIANEYYKKGLIKCKWKDCQLTDLGKAYIISLYISVRAMEDNICTNECRENIMLEVLPDNGVSRVNDRWYFSNEYIDWAIRYIEYHTFNDYLYELAKQLDTSGIVN